MMVVKTRIFDLRYHVRRMYRARVLHEDQELNTFASIVLSSIWAKPLVAELKASASHRTYQKHLVESVDKSNTLV